MMLAISVKRSGPEEAVTLLSDPTQPVSQERGYAMFSTTAVSGGAQARGGFAALPIQGSTNGVGP